MLNKVYNTQKASFTRRLFLCVYLSHFVLAMSSCQGFSRQPKKHLLQTQVMPADSCMHLYHAKGFQVEYFPDYKKVSVYNPWGGNVSLYYLYQNEKPASLPSDGVAVKIPVRSLAVASCTHVGFLDRLGLLSTVKGACNAQLIYQPEMRKSLTEGRLQDLGDNFSINAEKVLALRADALFWSGYGQFDTKIAFLQDSGLPVIENNEWMEQSPLARAEWLRFMAVFFNQEALADSLYAETMHAYQSLKDLADIDKSPRKHLLVGENFRGTWYVPGGRSYMAQLFRDASAEYFYANDTTSGSIALNVERVLRDMSASDVWVGVAASSLRELAEKDARYVWFEAYKNAEVYAYDKRHTPQGGSDFWESAVVRPDLLLSDFVKLLHPELMWHKDWIYLRKLE